MDPRYYIASYPRSGNTLVRMLLRHHFEINAPSVYYENRAVDKTGVPAPLLSELEDPLRTEGEICSEISMWKTHEVVAPEQVAGAIVVARDGRDALVSYAHYQTEIFKFPSTAAAYLSNLCCGNWWSSFHAYWRSLKNVAVIKYEDLVNPQVQVVDMLALVLSSIGVKASVATREPMASFASLRTVNPLFFRKGIVGAWKDEMSDTDLENFWNNNARMMAELGYAR